MSRWTPFLLCTLTACSGRDAPDPDDSDATTSTDTPADTTDTPADTTDTPADSADTPTDTPADPGDLAALLPGTWRPVSMNDSGGVQPIPDDPASYYLLGADGSLAFGCGTAPIGTWAFDPQGPPPSLGTVTASFGANVTWYIVSLDAQTWVFAEGGDLFEFTRAACP